MNADNEQMLSEGVRAEIDRWLVKFPDDQKQSAVIAALTAVQHEHGHVTTEHMDAVAAYLQMPRVSVYEVGSFYSMLELEPAGRHIISVCNNISCMLCGGEDILEHVEGKLGVKRGGTTPDGRFTIKMEEECLAACAGAPMMLIDGRYYENLTPEKVDEILDGLE